MSTAKQDTPGRPKPASSRQQTQPDQDIQSGSPELDVKYRDRPTEDGKQGDGDQEPNKGLPQ